MNVPYVLILPALLTATTAVYVFAGPSAERGHGAAEATLTPTATATAVASETPVATPASVATVAAAATGALPAGLTGRLTYRTGRTLVTVSFPSLEAQQAPVPDTTPGDPSPDGTWRVSTSCPNDATCTFVFDAADGRHAVTTVSDGLPGAAKWSRTGHALAYSVTPQGAIAARELVVIDDPAAPQPRVIASADGIGIYSYAWLADGRLLASLGGGASGGPHLVAVSLDGTQQRLVDTPATAPYMYPSPDGRLVAFTQTSAAGWHMFVYDTRDRRLRDLGNMGSDPAGVTPPRPVPPGEGKGPMYVSWSPNGRYLAFGGGFEPPYFMTTVDVAAGTAVRTGFPDGYPGEITWSPDGRLIAVSTYNIPRTHHESYVVEPATGVARDVLSGCVIVWSPDSRFLAVHGEKVPGVAIADVATLRQAQLTHVAGDAPVRWE